MSARSSWIVALAIAVLIAVPSAAQATLVFVRNPFNPVVWVAADDGSARHRVGKGSNPHVSPDGQMIAYARIGKGSAYLPELVVEPADGSGPPRSLLKGWREPSMFAWSPDSKTIAAVQGPEIGSQRLDLIDVAGGTHRTIARGYFSGVSFSPEGGQLVYGRSPRESFFGRGDLFRLDILPPGAVSVAAELPHRLTSDHRSLDPLWGPNGQIAFARQLGARKRRYMPKSELFLISPSGGRLRRLTHTKVDPLLQGLFPTDWSANGMRLLAEFEGQDTSYAVTVDPTTGKQRALTRDVEHGFSGSALSADGKLVLGQTGGFEPGIDHDVATVPYGGGRPRILVHNAFEPDWSR